MNLPNHMVSECGCGSRSDITSAKTRQRKWRTGEGPIVSATWGLGSLNLNDSSPHTSRLQKRPPSSNVSGSTTHAGAPRWENYRSPVSTWDPQFPTAYVAHRFLPSTMDAKPQRPNPHRDTSLSSLNMAIDAVNIAKEAMDMIPAKVIFASVGVILIMIKVGFSSLCCRIAG